MNEPNTGNQPGDRAGILSSGPFTIYPDSAFEFDVALVFARSYQTPNDNIAPVFKMKNFVDTILAYYHQNAIPCGGNFTSIKERKTRLQSFSVYPVPTKDFIFISPQDNQSEYSYTFYDSFGKKILSGQGKGKIKLQTQQLSAGVYFLQINTGKEKQRIKVVVSR